MMRYALPGVLALLAAHAHGADVPLKHDWFQIEVLIFERPAGADASPEQLPRREPRVFPLNTLAFDDGDDRSRAYPLDAYTQALPSLPPIDLQYFAEFGIHPSPPVRPRPEPPAPIAQPAPPPPTPVEQLAAMTAQFEDALTAQSLKWQPRAALKLTNEARRLGNVAGYRVLLHGAWIQAVPPRETPQPMLIEAGDRGGGGHAVEGTFAVTLQHYLHVDAELWYSPPPEAEASAADGSYLRLVEQRRVRSTEVHYFDHPRFGVLARIDAVEIPEKLRAFAAQVQDPGAGKSPNALSSKEPSAKQPSAKAPQ